MMRTAVPFLLASLPAILTAQTAADPPDKIFRHRTGISFRYPGAWEAREQGERVLVIPGDAARDAAGQPLEVCWLAREDAGDVRSVKDPRVAAYIESQVRQWQPAVKSLPDSRALRTGLGEAAVFGFEVPENGLKLEAYVVLHGGSAVLMVHAARGDLLAKRQAEISRVFASLEQGHAEPVESGGGIVGVWRRSQYIRTSPGGPPGTISSTTYFFFQFHGDGSFRFVERDRISGNTADLGVILGRDSGAQVRTGRWSAEGGVIRLAWGDGTVETFPYAVSAATLRLTLSGGRRPWVFDRVGGN